MGANDKLAATFHPATTSHMIDAVQYPVEGDQISVTERAQPIIDRLIREAKADAWDECEQAKYVIELNEQENAWEAVKPNPYRSTE